jgi:SsrA-binding protein
MTYNAAVNKSDKPAPKIISLNRRARHDYFIEGEYEAGLALEGLRAGKAQIAEAYVVIRNAEAWLIGAHISPLGTASTHVQPDPTRTRKLLLHRHELNKLIGATERQGYTLVPLSLHWQRGRAKLEIGLARGKKQHDKRASIKERDWQREKARVLSRR